MDNQHKKIAGYRDLSQAEIDVMNEIKAKATEVETLIAKLDSMYVDKRWLSIGTTGLQQGFMALTRSVAKPTNF